MKPRAKQAPAVRVGIYCRQSVEKGGDQALTSIDTQRQLVGSYVASQVVRGWIALPERYDDEGFSGKNMKRPAFQRLLAAVRDKRVDLVAVYRLDRMSRSSADFAGLMQQFERLGVQFVSVTENFDTSTPMGRFALGLLIQVAQLEREVTAERVRDKIATSRRNGHWTGGRPSLGYDSVNGRLVVNEAEAEQVRELFRLYRVHGTMTAVIAEARARGWTQKAWSTKLGKPAGGGAFDKSCLRALLRNPLYAGRIRGPDGLHEAQHEAIVEPAEWEAVQRQLEARRPEPRGAPRRPGDALLAGVLYCSCGARMGRTFTTRAGRRVEYYVCRAIQRHGARACPGSRAPLAQVDQFVVDRLRAIGRDPELVAATVTAARSGSPEIRAERERAREDAERTLATATRARDRLMEALEAGGDSVPSLVAKLAKAETAVAKARVTADTARADLDGPTIDPRALRDALAALDPIWAELHARERSRVMQLLVERVTLDVRAGSLEIAFRADGPRAFLAEVAA